VNTSLAEAGQSQNRISGFAGRFRCPGASPGLGWGLGSAITRPCRWSSATRLTLCLSA